jgi:hypothetical protein
MDRIAAVAVLAAVFVVRTTVVVTRATVVVALRTTSVQAMDWVGLVLGSSCLAGSFTSSGNGLATTP